MTAACPLFDELERLLAARVPRLLPDPSEARPASVLVPLYLDGGEPHLLFVKRPEGDYPHAGQVAFPGGRRDEGEEALACALREAHEEVGLEPSAVRVLGRLDEYDTVVTGYRVTPIVGVIPYPYPFRMQEREVERLLFVPLRTLLDPANCSTRQREWQGASWTIHYYQAGDDVVWGVTAGMLRPLLAEVRTLPSCPR